MDLVVMIGVSANIVVLASLLGGFVYGYGVLNSSVKTLKEDLAEIKADITPRMTDLTRLEMVVNTLVDVMKGLQDTLRGDLVKRLSRCENDIREIQTRCIERMHKVDAIAERK
jgi:hypothetical protein